MVFGEGYFQRKRNILGQVLELGHLPALNMRCKVRGGFVMLLPDGKQLHFDEEEVEHVMDYDVEQNIYGVPDYLGGMHALLLNESATLFRRRYFNNGAHAGFVFYTNDPNLTEEDEKALQAKIAGSKGGGFAFAIRQYSWRERQSHPDYPGGRYLHEKRIRTDQKHHPK